MKTTSVKNQSPRENPLRYKNEFLYNALTYIKLGTSYHERSKIASRHIQRGESVLDICSGAGQLKHFLAKDAPYTCLEISPAFIAQLKKRDIPCVCADLRDGLPSLGFKADAVIMIISLCQFHDTSVHQLLEDLKEAGRKVIIVEDVQTEKRSEFITVEKTIGFLRSKGYVTVDRLFDREEFKRLMQQHHYQYRPFGQRYAVGYYHE